MSYCRLTDFLEELGHAGELARVEIEVDPELEAAEIIRRIDQKGVPAVLFSATGQRKAPLLVGALRAEARICRAMGVRSLDEAADRLANLAASNEPQGWLERLKGSPHLAASSKFMASEVRSGACQQVVELGADVDLNRWPLTRSAAEETHRAITAGVVLAGGGTSAAGCYPMQLLDANRLAACWDDHDPVAALLGEYRGRGEKMPVAIVLGGPPAFLLAAMAPVNSSVDSPTDIMALAGLLAEQPLEVVTCRTIPLQVPAEAEIVIEGYVDPSEPLVEAGPLRMAAGHCRPSRDVPVMDITAVTHRANPVFPAMALGGQTCEVSVIDRALSRVFLPWVKAAIPELVNYDLPMYGAAGQWATLSIRKTHAGQAHRVAHAAWGQRQFMFAKVLVIVDEDIDVHNSEEVLASVARNMNPARDVVIARGTPDPADASTPSSEMGQFMAIDATRKLPAEHGGPWLGAATPETATTDPAIADLVDERWEAYGLGPRKESVTVSCESRLQAHTS